MEDIINNILSKLGIPSMLISLVLFVIRIRLVTLITSNSIERKMFSKEKQLVIKVMKLFFEIMMTVLFLFIITDNLFKYKSIYNSSLAIIAVVSLLIIFIVVLTLKEVMNKNFKKLLGKSRNWIRIPAFVLCSLIIVCYYLLPAYYVGTQIYSEFYLKGTTTSEKNIILIAVFILYFIITICVLVPISRIMYQFMGFDELNPNKLNDKPVYIEYEGERWYLYHPVNNTLYYLANETHLTESTKFRYLQREELIKQILRIDKPVN
ncbi:hypothetical protein M3194_20565 [Paenibacillus glycanilyticus]|uniref:hypothetical protein n=1 Tax=Paenibacillus glycanilyticus TaxID=126569 RepID=UPI00203CAF3E|nr:hypothetical protein [Paenibacillus glycanilyticus]MCM3629738.1 hypothetical protein [Paenibacillus glycanilyticus]